MHCNLNPVQLSPRICHDWRLGLHDGAVESLRDGAQSEVLGTLGPVLKSEHGLLEWAALKPVHPPSPCFWLEVERQHLCVPEHDPRVAI